MAETNTPGASPGPVEQIEHEGGEISPVSAIYIGMAVEAADRGDRGTAITALANIPAAERAAVGEVLALSRLLGFDVAPRSAAAPWRRRQPRGLTPRP